MRERQLSSLPERSVLVLLTPNSHVFRSKLTEAFVLQGLGLDPDTIKTMGQLGLQTDFDLINRPITCEEYRWVDSQSDPHDRSAVPIIVNEAHHHVRCASSAKQNIGCGSL